MRILHTAILTTLLIPALLSCEGSLLGEKGNGVSAEKEIQVGEFDRISIPSFVDVHYTQTTGEQSVKLTCDENLAEFYVVEVKDGELVVGTKNTILNAKSETFVTVSSPDLREVNLSGSGDFDCSGSITTDKDFTLKISGSGDADIADLTAGDALISLTGSGDADVERMNVSSVEFKISGSGGIDAEAVTAENISIKTTGSGDCELNCKNSGTISVQISGSGDVHISGTARAIVNISQNGSGDFDMSGLTLSGK